ncbi:MAG: glutaredoxin family protein [Ferrimonas sp.]
MPKWPITLYHTSGCHLCKQAQQLLVQQGIEAVQIDIITNPELITRYGHQIPVLRHHNGAELGWPFDAKTLSLFCYE